ncbi:MAG: alpha/beta fold hydrolase [Burkholderiaceae bacterium]
MLEALQSVQVHARIEGSGPDLLLLHGLFGNSRNWLAQQRELATDWRVHALDLRNHGQSPWHPATGSLDMAADVRRYCVDHDIGSCAVLGHSMGGKTAMALALAEPARVRSLIVVDIAPVPNPPTLGPVVKAMRAVSLAGITQRQAVGEQLAAAMPDAQVRAFLLQNLVHRDGRLHWRINLEAIDDGMAETLGFPAELADRRFDGPTGFIVGALSDYVRPEHRATFENLFPGYRLLSIGQAGHWVHAEQPAAFLEATRSLLTR